MTYSTKQNAQAAAEWMNARKGYTPVQAVLTNFGYSVVHVGSSGGLGWTIIERY